MRADPHSQQMEGYRTSSELTTLDTIEKNRKDVKDCLSDVLTQWLNKAYNMQRFGQPSWQLLVSAVRHPAGGDNQALADTMAAKYGGRTLNALFTA